MPSMTGFDLEVTGHIATPPTLKDSDGHPENPRKEHLPRVRYENIYEYDASLKAKGLAIGIVMSRFNQDIGEGLLSACTGELKRLASPTATLPSPPCPGGTGNPIDAADDGPQRPL
jgi:hypothetical protein